MGRRERRDDLVGAARLVGLGGQSHEIPHRLGAHVLKATNIDDLKRALAEARQHTRTTVIVIETDPNKRAPGYDSWWDVPLSEVSTMPAVRRARAEFEKAVKKKFIDEPGQMKLLIVVDKLLTGFDAPSATYLYIDKQMRDHGLFQAICRVNRLDGDDKEYGYIVDYKIGRAHV